MDGIETAECLPCVSLFIVWMSFLCMQACVTAAYGKSCFGIAACESLRVVARWLPSCRTTNATFLVARVSAVMPRLAMSTP